MCFVAAGVVVAAIGVAASVVGQVRAADDANKLGKAQRRQANLQAEDEFDVAKSKIEKLYAEAAARRGRMRARFGAAGVVGDEGNVVDLLAQETVFAEFDARTILAEAKRRAFAIRSAGALGNFSAQTAASGQLFGAASSGIVGAGNILSQAGRIRASQTGQASLNELRDIRTQLSRLGSSGG